MNPNCGNVPTRQLEFMHESRPSRPKVPLEFETHPTQLYHWSTKNLCRSGLISSGGAPVTTNRIVVIPGLARVSATLSRHILENRTEHPARCKVEVADIRHKMEKPSDMSGSVCCRAGQDSFFTSHTLSQTQHKPTTPD
jgi:hypothetical protein